MEHDRSSSTIISTKEITTIYIITPTYYRLSQKADLTRMANTLRLVTDIFWLLVEDADQTSDSIAELLIQSRLPHAYIAAKTPIDLRFNESDSNWKDPHGVVQRNAALDWIRFEDNLGTHKIID
jgi:galactosylgalactosylxylosylprotein 3-beta-glucuronosyltransferase 3